MPTTVVHKEMCMNPVAKGWLRASIDLWRRLCKVASDSLLGMAVRESLASHAGEGGGSAPKSWAGRFMHTVPPCLTKSSCPCSLMPAILE